MAKALEFMLGSLFISLESHHWKDNDCHENNGRHVWYCDDSNAEVEDIVIQWSVTGSYSNVGTTKLIYGPQGQRVVAITHSESAPVTNNQTPLTRPLTASPELRG
jgi:hypothetical protein